MTAGLCVLRPAPGRTSLLLPLTPSSYPYPISSPAVVIIELICCTIARHPVDRTSSELDLRRPSATPRPSVLDPKLSPNASCRRPSRTPRPRTRDPELLQWLSARSSGID